MRQALVLVAALTVACPAPRQDLPADFAAQLTAQRGCGDMTVYAHSADDTLALIVEIDGIAEAAHSVGEPLRNTYDLSEANGPLVEALLGEELTIDLCTDALTGTTWVADAYVAVSGTAIIDVVPTDTATDFTFPADATIELTNVVFRRDDGAEYTLPSFTLSANIGSFGG